MTKDVEIEQVLSLPNVEWQRKKLRLPHSQKREAEKPQKRRSREPTLFKDYSDSARANLTFMGANVKYMGAKQRFMGTNVKNMGANVAIVTFAPTIPCFAKRNLLYSTSVINHAMNYGINNEESP